MPNPTADRERRRISFGQSNRTVSSVESGVSKFNKYRESVNEKVLDELTDADVGGEGGIKDVILADWAMYMGRSPYTWPNGDLLGASTHSKYFESVTNELKAKFPRHPDFAAGYATSWYNEMKNGIKSNVERYKNASGAGFRDTGVTPLYRDLGDTRTRHIFSCPDQAEDLNQVVTKLLRKADPNKFWKRLEVVMQYLAVGRGEEPKFVNYEDVRWDQYLQVVDATWVENKTLRSYPVAFTCDANKYNCDIFDALGDVFSCSNGLWRSNMPSNAASQPRSKKAICAPAIGKSSGWQAKRISDTLKSQFPEEERKGISSKSLRQGGTTVLNVDRNVTESEKLARTGHTPSDSAGRFYQNPTLGTQIVPANSLSGHDTTALIHVPRLEALVRSNQIDDAEKVMNMLYVPCNIAEFMEGGRLRGTRSSNSLLRVIFASQLRHFSSKMADLGRTHLAIDKVIQATIAAEVANSPGEAVEKLNIWSSLISADYVDMNSNLSGTANATDRDLIIRMGDMMGKLMQKVTNVEVRQLKVDAEFAAMREEVRNHILNKRSSDDTSLGESDRPIQQRRLNDGTAVDASRNNEASSAATAGGTGRSGPARTGARNLLNMIGFGAAASGEGGIEVKDTLRDLVQGGKLKNDQALCDTRLTRLDSKERARYVTTMNIVDDEWTTEEEALLRRSDLNTNDNNALEQVYNDVNSRVLQKMNDMEIEVGLRAEKNRNVTKTQKASYVRVAIRYNDVQKKKTQAQQPPSILSRVANVLSPRRSSR